MLRVDPQRHRLVRVDPVALELVVRQRWRPVQHRGHCAPAPGICRARPPAGPPPDDGLRDDARRVVRPDLTDEAGHLADVLARLCPHGEDRGEAAGPRSSRTLPPLRSLVILELENDPGVLVGVEIAEQATIEAHGLGGPQGGSTAGLVGDEDDLLHQGPFLGWPRPTARDDDRSVRCIRRAR
ncbi:hypothetical protein FAGKG844_60165 [Frankia sp. AgKG'84/4]